MTSHFFAISGIFAAIFALRGVEEVNGPTLLHEAATGRSSVNTSRTDASSAPRTTVMTSATRRLTL
jgi:hypothetical protein